MKRFFVFIQIVVFFSCKKIDITPNPPPLPASRSFLHSFQINLDQSTINTATISWTTPSDSASDIHYSVFLDSNLLSEEITDQQYTFLNLQPNKQYSVIVEAYNSSNDSISSSFVFTTKDNFLKFTKKLPAEFSIVYGLTITPQNGYLFTYGSNYDTLFQGDGTPETQAIHIAEADSLGNILWTKRYDFQYCQPGSKIKNTTGGYLVMGANYIMKTNYKGDIIWKKLPDKKNSSIFSSFIETHNKEIALVGLKNTIPTTLFMMMLNENGQLKWERNYSVNGTYPTLDDLVEIPSENSFILLGTIDEVKFRLCKIDNTGNQIWQTSFGDTSKYALARQMIKLGNELLVAGINVGGLGIDEMLIFRLDLNGNLIRKTAVSSPNFGDDIRSFDLTQDSGYIILASIGTLSGDFYNAVFKFDENDNKQWENYYSELGYAYSIKQTSDSGYVFIPNALGSEYRYIIKTNKFGLYY